MGSRPPGVTWRPVRRSPDFPLQPQGCSDCLADSDFLPPDRGRDFTPILVESQLEVMAGCHCTESRQAPLDAAITRLTPLISAAIAAPKPVWRVIFLTPSASSLEHPYASMVPAAQRLGSCPPRQSRSRTRPLHGYSPSRALPVRAMPPRAIRTTHCSCSLVSSRPDKSGTLIAKYVRHVRSSRRYPMHGLEEHHRAKFLGNSLSSLSSIRASTLAAGIPRNRSDPSAARDRRQRGVSADAWPGTG